MVYSDSAAYATVAQDLGMDKQGRTHCLHLLAAGILQVVVGLQGGDKALSES